MRGTRQSIIDVTLACDSSLQQGGACVCVCVCVCVVIVSFQDLPATFWLWHFNPFEIVEVLWFVVVTWFRFCRFIVRMTSWDAWWIRNIIVSVVQDCVACAASQRWFHLFAQSNVSECHDGQCCSVPKFNRDVCWLLIQWLESAAQLFQRFSSWCVVH